jgi:uncharacterized protein (TIGR03435 family)
MGPFAVACFVFGEFGIANLHAQSPAFEVASIKPSPGVVPMTVIGPELRNGMLRGERITLRMLLAAGYGVTEPRIIGPDWLDKSRFDVIAKSLEGVPNSDLKPMLRTLLKDRFKLAAHLELKEMSVYFLGVAKGGVRMPVYPARDLGPDHQGDARYRGFPIMRGTGTAARLALVLSRILKRPVIDKTGLTERYNYFLSFAPLSPQAADNTPEFSPPDIFTAVKEQLGLTLQSGRDNVEVVIVDHMERMPTEN